MTTRFDDELREALEPLAGDRHATARAVLERLPASRPVGRWRQPVGLVAAAAAGLLIGLVLREDPPTPYPGPPVLPISPSMTPEPTGRLRFAQGAVFAVAPDASTRELTALDAIRTGDRIVTREHSLAEIVMADGTQLRLAHDTSLLLAGMTLQIERGRFWVHWTDEQNGQRIVHEQGSIEISGASEVDVWALADEFGITTLAGKAFLVSDVGTRRSVKENQRCSIRAGTLRDREYVYWPTEVRAWMMPLLCGETHPEEIDRMAGYFLEMLDNPDFYGMGERGLRQMGHCSSRPLLAFLKETAVGDARPLRARAANLVADVADIDGIGPLFELLRDPDPRIRAPISRAIVRVSGITRQNEDFWMTAAMNERENEATDWRREIEGK